MPRKTAPTLETSGDVKDLINRRFGAGTMTFGSDPDLEISRIPTGILSIDFGMNGGFARGRSVELYGGEHTGKTSLAMHLLAECQRLGGKGAYVDCEKTFNQRYAQHVGIDIDTLGYHRQRDGHQVVDFMETLLYSKEYDVIVMDSIASLLPKSERENDMSAGSMGMEQAKLMSKALRKLTTANGKTVLVFINQTRQAVGVMFGDQDVTSGGRSMAFYASTRLKLTKIETIKSKRTIVDPKTTKDKEADVPTGHRVLVKVQKEKTGAMHAGSQISTVFSYDLQDFDPIEDLIYVGRQIGIVKNSGDSFWVEGYDQKSANRKAFYRWLATHPDACAEIEFEARAQIELAE